MIDVKNIIFWFCVFYKTNVRDRKLVHYRKLYWIQKTFICLLLWEFKAMLHTQVGVYKLTYLKEERNAGNGA